MISNMNMYHIVLKVDGPPNSNEISKIDCRINEQ